MTKKLFNEKLKSSCLTAADAKKLHITYQTAAQTEKLVGKKLTGIKIAYYDTEGKSIKDFYRVRFLEAPKTFGNGKAMRYSQPTGRSPRLYLPTNIDWKKVSKDTDQKILITEGEFKAACASKHGIPTIGLGGVYNFMSKKDEKPLIKDFDAFDWKGRLVYIVFDADAADNAQVRTASRRLAQQLLKLGADIHTGFVPEMDECEKAGIDDFIASRGKEEFLSVLADCEPFSESQHLHAMNEEVVYCRNPSFIVKLSNFQKMNAKTFTSEAYANRNITSFATNGAPRIDNVAALWLKWERRNEVEGICYKPGQPQFIDNKLNEWSGWGCKPKKGSIAPWDKLMNYVFRGDKKARHWFESWCAIQFQQPGIKLYSACLLWSSHEGTGKSLIGQTLGEIFGDNFSEIGHDELIDGYNSWAVNKQFVLGDEVSATDKRAVTDKLKRMITRSSAIVKIKYVPEYKVEDTVNYYLTSNHPDAINMDDQDRRYFVWEIEGAPMAESFYLDTYDKWLRGDGPSHLFQYFLDYDIGDFQARTRAYVSKAKIEMIESTKTDLGSWVHTLYHNPEAVLRHLGGPIKKDLFTNAELLAIYDPDKRTRVTANGLGRELKRKGFEKTAAPVKLSTGEQRHPWMIRNVKKWANAQPAAIRDHVEPPIKKEAKEKAKKYK